MNYEYIQTWNGLLRLCLILSQFTILFILQGMIFPSVAYVHAHLVLLRGGQRKKIFVETLDILTMVSYNIPNQSLMNIKNQLPFTLNTCFASSLSPFFLPTWRPRWCNFECNLAKIGLRIAPSKKFLLNLTELHHRALSGILWNNSLVLSFKINDS